MTLKSFINVFERNGLHVSVKTETTTIDNCFRYLRRVFINS